jgi:hypothetical protein
MLEIPRRDCGSGLNFGRDGPEPSHTSLTVGLNYPFSPDAKIIDGGRVGPFGDHATTGGAAAIGCLGVFGGVTSPPNTNRSPPATAGRHRNLESTRLQTSPSSGNRKVEQP